MTGVVTGVVGLLCAPTTALHHAHALPLWLAGFACICLCVWVCVGVCLLPAPLSADATAKVQQFMVHAQNLAAVEEKVEAMKRVKVCVCWGKGGEKGGGLLPG